MHAAPDMATGKKAGNERQSGLTANRGDELFRRVRTQ